MQPGQWRVVLGLAVWASAAAACESFPDDSRADEDSESGGAAASDGSWSMGGWAGAGGAGSCPFDDTVHWCESRADLSDSCSNYPRPDGMTRDEFEADCRVTLADRVSHVEPCYWASFAACINSRGGCQEDDFCSTDALQIVAPSQLDEAAYQQCKDGNQAACKQTSRGFLRDCIERSATCNVSDDECIRAAALLPEYLEQAEACLTEPCADWAKCRAIALGDSKE